MPTAATNAPWPGLKRRLVATWQSYRRGVAEISALATERGADGRTLLWEAVRNGHREVVDFLIDNGSDVNAPGAQSDIFTAAYLGDTTALASFLDHSPPKRHQSLIRQTTAQRC